MNEKNKICAAINCIIELRWRFPFFVVVPLFRFHSFILLFTSLYYTPTQVYLLQFELKLFCALLFEAKSVCCTYWLLIETTISKQTAWPVIYHESFGFVATKFYSNVQFGFHSCSTENSHSIRNRE